MKKQFISVLSICLSLAILCISLCACSSLDKNSTFSIRFIDVGEGDSALVQCDGHYMLIDGGNVSAGESVYNRLFEEKVNKLDILAISHLHADHIGGIPKALTYASSIGLTIGNAKDCEIDSSHKKEVQKLTKALSIVDSKITIPTVGSIYHLGSADVEVLDVANENHNDSLVLLITYGNTKFLFTGDIESGAQEALINKVKEKYKNKNPACKITLMKMPHHGAYTESLSDFMEAFAPDNVVISVGKKNGYRHPAEETLRLLNSKVGNRRVYRTDDNGDVLVISNGKKISIKTEKKKSWFLW